MVELIGGSSGSGYIPRYKVEEMKKNMKKVPKIQKKSDEFHKKQAESAEDELQKAQEIIQGGEEKSISEEKKQEIIVPHHKNMYQKIIKRIKSKFQ